MHRRAAHTCEHLVHIALAAALDHPPAGALDQVQQVVVHPEAHQHLNREGKHLQHTGEGAMSMLTKRQLNKPANNVTFCCFVATDQHQQSPCIDISSGLSIRHKSGWPGVS